MIQRIRETEKCQSNKTKQTLNTEMQSLSKMETEKKDKEFEDCRKHKQCIKTKRGVK